jgi:transposase-like protein
MADGIKSTVKRFTKDVRMVDIQEEDSEPTSRERVEIPFTTSHIQYFLKEALGDEHTLRLKCMLALREGMPMTRIAAANGATISEIRGWRDALAKAGPVALIPKDAIEPFRPKLSAQQATVLNALKFDQPDGKGKTAKALLMLDNNGYPPFVAECVQATVKDLRAWVCNVEAYAGPRAAEGSSWTHSSAGVQEKAHVVTGTTGLSDFQRQVLDVVVQARGVRGEAAIARVARRNDIPLQVVEKWLDKVKRHGSDGLLAETAATPVRMPETSSAKELRGLALTVSQPAANELRALAYIYDGASIATSARICMMSKDDLSELVLDFNMFGLEALGFTGDQPMAMAVGM